LIERGLDNEKQPSLNTGLNQKGKKHVSELVLSDWNKRKKGWSYTIFINKMLKIIFIERTKLFNTSYDLMSNYG
jgi:hypothetical protein